MARSLRALCNPDAIGTHGSSLPLQCRGHRRREDRLHVAFQPQRDLGQVVVLSWAAIDDHVGHAPVRGQPRDVRRRMDGQRRAQGHHEVGGFRGGLGRLLFIRPLIICFPIAQIPPTRSVSSAGGWRVKKCGNWGFTGRGTGTIHSIAVSKIRPRAVRAQKAPILTAFFFSAATPQSATSATRDWLW